MYLIFKIYYQITFHRGSTYTYPPTCRSQDFFAPLLPSICSHTLSIRLPKMKTGFSMYFKSISLWSKAEYLFLMFKRQTFIFCSVSIFIFCLLLLCMWGRGWTFLTDLWKLNVLRRKLVTCLACKLHIFFPKSFLFFDFDCGIF